MSTALEPGTTQLRRDLHLLAVLDRREGDLADLDDLGRDVATTSTATTSTAATSTAATSTAATSTAAPPPPPLGRVGSTAGVVTFGVIGLDKMAPG